MTTIEDYGKYETAWCPGCGNFGILNALKQALVNCDLPPHRVLLVSGIGQAAKAPHYLRANVFNGLHGRSLPAAIGARLANPELTVIAESGDGCLYGEGGNHFLAALRRNLDLTILAHDNRVYGLTKGQASPTSQQGMVTKTQPHGAFPPPFNPLAVAVTMGASFVARGYAGKLEQLSELISKAIKHRGTALVDILQPCVSFNKINTFQWYQEHCYELPPEHDPTDRDQALRVALEFGENLPLGIIYQTQRPLFEEQFTPLKHGPLARQEVSRPKLEEIMQQYR
ncbi:thiamine pyrophosphate-dependent enzyme [Desulfurivibrio alkaliphilus]|uniref:Pyruvate ferredoxin/flavodoxin oxidoreductase, beta subunit n=1 Tax=Desulfurivibrio alkaliphilus (strain DSM 19089 / UNIQEM U267 / AHT2) TaxID=589865 RepID=D6Z630_DESAT|nr:thiamine pyrophosphate-dependent enzyme [Desulfurivibrio alkaliphilus]ADH84912.1 pyruvate ferredoxin/flavodoxin oxidoreductase, beta subunit [Desulfurivibrio alkaliphilus AHT 2]